MSWVNVGAINLKKGWQYTSPVVGDYFRLRHSHSSYDLPYGFRGLVAQSFGWQAGIELLNVKRIYPRPERTIYLAINPFPDQERRLALRGSSRYITRINWLVMIDAWTGESIGDPYLLGMV